MLADCLAGDRRFGITPTGGTAELPEPGTVGCTAVVRVNQELPDGRSNIVVLGAERFVLAGAVDDPAPYHVALVQPFEDDPGSDPPAESSDHLRELFAAYHLLLRELHDTEPEDADLPADSVGPVLPRVGRGRGRRRSQAAAPGRALDRAPGRGAPVLLPILTARVESALKVHRRGHTNGRGGTRPDSSSIVTPELIDALARIVGARWVRSRRAELATFTHGRASRPGSPSRRGRAAGRPRPGTRGGAAAVPGRRAVRRPRRRHRALRRRGRRSRRRAHRAHPNEPDRRAGPGAPARDGAARGGQRPAHRGRRAARAALRPRSLQPDRLHRGRQRGRERRRTPLPQVRRDHQSRGRARGGAPRRRGGPVGLAPRRAVGARPGGTLRGQRGDVRDRDRDHGAAGAAARPACAPCWPTSPRCAPPARRSPG